jgi:hypothetical protein
VCGPGPIEPIDLPSDLVPVIGHRLANGYLQILSDTILGIAGHAVCFLWIVVGLVGHVADPSRPVGGEVKARSIPSVPGVP